MSRLFVTDDDEMKVFGSLSGFELYRPTAQNENGNVIAGFNIGTSRFMTHDDYIARIEGVLNKNIPNNQGGHNPFGFTLRHASMKNKPELINGVPIYLNYNSMDMQDINNSIHQFGRTKKGDFKNLFFFDIETIGESIKRGKKGGQDNYSLSEFSVVNYMQDQNGNRTINTKNSLNLLMRIDENTKDKVQELLDRVGNDRYKFYSLTDSEQRQLIDLMRYSKMQEAGYASFSSKQGGLLDTVKVGSLNEKIYNMDITHNALVEERFTDKFGKIDYERVLQEWDRSYLHMQSGLKTLTSTNLASQTAGATFIEQFLKDQQKGLFVSYNGYEFDKPLVKDFITKELMKRENIERRAQGKPDISYEQSVKEREKFFGRVNGLMNNHLDLYRLVESVYGSVGELEKAITKGDNHNRLMSKKLQALREFLPKSVQDALDQMGSAHNAQADNHVLAAIFDELHGDISDRIRKAPKKTSQLQQVDSRNFSKGPEKLKFGMQLVSNRALVTNDEYDPYSFVKEGRITGRDPETGKAITTYGLAEASRGRVILRRESLYEFRGIKRIENIDGEIAYRAQFYNVLDDEHAFVIRTGHNAQSELAKFINENFSTNDYMNFDRFSDQRTKDDTLYKMTKEQILDDRARRYYSSMFAPDNYAGGTWIDRDTGQLKMAGSKGFNAVLLSAQANDIYQKYLEERDASVSHIDPKTGRHVYKEGYDRKKAGLNVRTQIEDLFQNENHTNHFFRLRGRLADELPLYKEAIETIEKQYTNEIARLHTEALEEVYARQGGDKTWYKGESFKLLNKEYTEKIREIQQKQNMAISFFHQQVEQLMEQNEEFFKTNKEKVRPLKEKWIVKLTDPQRNAQVSIDFADFSKARMTMLSYLKQTTYASEDKLPKIRQERFTELTSALYRQGVISEDDFYNLRGLSNNPNYAPGATYVNALFETVTKRQQQIIRDVNKANPNLSFEERMNLAFENSAIERVVEQEALNIRGNKNLATFLKEDIQKQFTENAIERTENFMPRFHYLNPADSSTRQVELPPSIRNYLSQLDQKRGGRSILKANNVGAVEKVLTEMSNTLGSGYSVFVSLDQDVHGRYTGVSFMATEYAKGSNALNTISRGELPNSILKFSMPIIDENGFMKTGNIKMNANMVTSMETINGKRQATLISTQDALAEILIKKVKQAKKYIEADDLIVESSGYRKASKFMQDRVTEYLSTLSGSDKESGLQYGDTAIAQGNLMDFRKQQHVLFEDAYIRDLYDRGFGDFKLTDDSFRENAFKTNEDGIKTKKDYLSINDLKEKEKMKALTLRASWWESNRGEAFEDVFLTLGSVKSSNADKFLIGLDNQAYMPMGMLHDTVRDPMSQAFGAEMLTEDIRDRIKGIRGVQTDLSYVSMMQYELAKELGNVTDLAKGIEIADTVQIKTAYMTNTDMFNRVNKLMEDDYARSVLQKHKLIEMIDQAEVERIEQNIRDDYKRRGADINKYSREQVLLKDGYVKKIGDEYFKIDPLRLPNTYEQQSVVDQEFLDAMKIQNSRRYSSDFQIQLLDGFDENTVLKADDKFAKIIYANGTEDFLHYDGKGPGKIGSILRNKDGSIYELKTHWEEAGFKAFSFAEKSTMQGLNRELISLITGDEDVVMIHAGEVFKHKEHGHFLARLQAELSMDIRNSAGEARSLKIKAIQDANLGLIWNDTDEVLIDDTYVKPTGYAGGQNEDSILKRGGTSQKYAYGMESLLQTKDQKGNFVFAGFENKFKEEISTGIEQFRLAKIINTAKAVDDKRRKFLGYEEYLDEDGVTKNRPVYSSDLKDGVNIGHREIRTMRSQGMVETMAHIQRKMLDKSKESMELSGIKDLKGYQGIDYNHKITLAQELDNMIASIEMAVDAGGRKDEFAITRRIQDFSTLPTRNYDPSMYHHTVFDMNTILEESLQERAVLKGQALYGESFNQIDSRFRGIYNEVKAAHEAAPIDSADRIRGFWLELPTVYDQTGKEILPVIKDKSKHQHAEGLRAGRKSESIETNKIFVPLMHASQDKGNRYLNQIQQHVRAIVERAERATNASSYEDRVKHVRELSDMISNYYRTMVSEVSSSKGYINNNLNRFTAENSASGLYKLLDAQASQAFQKQYSYDGEFTVMHLEDARAMGLSEGEIDAIKSGKKEIFVGQVRYPSFHDGAVQYNRLFIGEEGQVARGEFRTSTFQSILKNADSDGDNSFMFLIRDDKVQAEMKGFQSKRVEKYRNAYDKYMSEKKSFDERVLEMDMHGGDHIRQLLGDEILDIRGANTSQEVVAKVWKGIVGQVSNLNYDMQQLASDMLERGLIDQGEYARTLKFGELLEQKIIDSKHGAEGVSSQIIQSIKQGNWTEAETLMRQHYAAKDKVTGEIKMLSVFDGKRLVKTVNESIFDQDNAFDTARQVILRSTTHYQTELGKLNIVGLDYGKSSGFLGTLEEFAEISRNSNIAQSSGMMTRHNTYLNLLHGHLGINQEALRTSAQMQADAAAIDLRNSAVTVNGMSAQIASDRERRLLQSVSANPVMDLIDPSIASGAGRSKMLAGGAIAVGALVGYNVLIGNSKPPAYNHENSQQFKRQYTSEEIYAEPSTQSQNTAGMMAELTDHSYNDRQFEGHKAESAAVGRAEDYTQQQFASVMIQAKGLSRIDDGVTSLVNQAMVGSGMVTGATNIRLTTTDNTRNLDRIWYRDQVENQL